MHRLSAILAGAVIFLGGCASKPPEDAENICEIFSDKRGWYRDAHRSSKRWGSDIGVMMSFIYQESSFRSRAKPPRTKILWVIPGPRPASAYGYSQATKETWRAYQRATGRGGADRNDFDDAVDFIGWYNDQSHRKNGIAKTDAYNLYLAYHEGHGGFERNTHRKKQWLKDTAQKVASRATRYRQQLNGCEKKFRRGWLSRLLFWG